MAAPLAVGAARAVGSAVGQVGIQLALEKAFFNKDVKNTTKNVESAFSQSFDKVEKKSSKTFSAIGTIIKTAFAIVGIRAVTNFAKTAINAASQTQAAWTGLNSIVTGTGGSFAEAKGFIEEYISDGLIPLEDAITSYKNLAARGYTTKQIEQTMIALKDAAAFGRQGSYSYGDAIKSATEGLKNENSILVDNAGVTKNVAKMWDDYAKSIGTTANELTQQQKIQAEVNGILEETKFQTGDAAAYANTFSGKIARISTAFYNFKVAVGKFVAPIVELFLPYVEAAINALTRFFNKMGQVLKVFGLEMPDVISKSSSTIAGLGDDASSTSDSIASTGDAAQKAAKKIKKAFANVDEINVLNTSNKNSSGGSGSDGSSGGSSGETLTDITEIGDVTESVDSSAVKIANKIKELFEVVKQYIEPLTKIDLSNLANSFEKIKIAVEPLTQKLFSGLEWLWFNVLVPFTTWTIEDAIPSFFNTLAGALDFLNGVIDYAKPYLQYLWEEFLLPIAKWTGGVIVDTLNWIGDALSKIGKWLSDNAPTIKSVRDTLDPFTNLIKQMAEALGKILGLGWDIFAWTLEKLWNNALKPIWEYLLQPLLTNLWSKFSGLASILGGIFEAFNLLMEGDWKGAGISIINGLIEGLSEIWEGSFVKKYLVDPIINGFKRLFGIHSPSTVFEGFGKNIIQGLVNGLLGLKDLVLGAWQTVLGWFTDIVVAVKTIFTTTKEIVVGWWNSIKSWWGERYLEVKTIFNTGKEKVKEWWNGVKNWWNELTGQGGGSSTGKGSSGSTKGGLGVRMYSSTEKSTVSGWFSKIKEWWGTKKLNVGSSNSTEKKQVSGWWSTIKNWWGSKKLGVGTTNSTSKSQVSKWWSNIKSWWGSKTLSITPKISEATGSVKSFTNEIISKLNSKLPDWLPKIPKLAQGGWLKANNPQLAIVGDNKHEPEIVAPESKIKEQVVKGLEEVGTNTSQQIEIVLNVKYEDGKSIIKKINNTQIKDGKISLLV